MKIVSSICALVALLALGGCASSAGGTSGTSGNLDVIDKIKAQHDSFALSQNDVYSEIALLMAPKVIMPHIVIDGASHPIGYGGKSSFYLTRTIENNDITASDLTQIRDELANILGKRFKSIASHVEAMDKNTSYKSIMDSDTSTEFATLAKLVKKHGLYIRMGSDTVMDKKSIDLDAIIAYLKNGNSNFKYNFKYGIYNGLKFSSLYVGNDMMEYYTDTPFTKKEQVNGNAQLRVITGLLQIKDVLYFEVNSFMSVINATLKLKENIDNIVTDSVYRSIALDIQSVYSQVRSAGSASFTANNHAKIYNVPAYFTGSDNNLNSLKKYIEGSDENNEWSNDNTGNWSTYRYTDINVRNLKDWIGGSETN
jgi:hypothetical protein